MKGLASKCVLSRVMKLLLCVSCPSKQRALAEEARCGFKRLQTAVYIHGLYSHRSFALLCSPSLLQMPRAAHIRHKSQCTVCHVINPELFPNGGGGCMQCFLHDSVALLSLRNAKTRAFTRLLLQTDS